MTDNRPLGIFDSGVGGLTVLRAIHDLVPREPTIYVGDLACFPYGPKEREAVQDRARAVSRYLGHRDIKALVVACNTATSAALEIVEASFSGPVVGVVRPGAEQAVNQSSRHRIGVVATEGSVRSHAYARAIAAVCPDCETFEVAMGRLVELVESGQGHGDETIGLITSTVEILLDVHDCDTIVLGCTHFPLVREEFERAAAGRALIVDSATSTARALRQLLEDSGLSAAESTSVNHEFLATAHADSFVRQAQVLFGEHVQAGIVAIPSPEGLPVGAAG